MKKKDGMTGWLMKCSSSCLIFMGCSLMITGFCLLLTGCTEKARKMEKKNIKVETISVGNTNLGGMKDYVGTIEEKMGSTLSFEIAGNITSIRVDEGDRVSKGQLLATINPTTVKEAHRATLTTLKQAEDAYRRFLPLHQSGTISDMKWVEIESKLEQAKAAESIARQQLSHSTLTAPFSGVIAAKNVDMGTYVLPGQPVLKLANVAQVNAKVSVPEAEISHLHVGDKVKLTVAALSGAVSMEPSQKKASMPTLSRIPTTSRWVSPIRRVVCSRVWSATPRFRAVQQHRLISSFRRKALNWM